VPLPLETEAALEALRSLAGVFVPEPRERLATLGISFDMVVGVCFCVSSRLLSG